MRDGPEDDDEDDPVFFKSAGAALTNWFKCVEWTGESWRTNGGEKSPPPGWVKRCPHYGCGVENPGPNLHCDRHRRMWMERAGRITE